MSTELFHRIANLDAEVTVPEDGIVSRTIYQDDHLKVVLFGFAPGQELSEHTASMPAIMHFVRGSARVAVANEESDATAGTWVHMQANVSHSVLAQEDTVMLLLLLKCGKPAGAKVAGGHL
jgi:quercetin dioxygenase-like cupin family protein